MTYDKDFKDAISNLPEKEKDKLILRLLKRDLDLTNQLYFELVSGDTQQSRRAKAIKKIEFYTEYFKKSENISIYFTPGVLMMYMRDTSGIINDHVKITKDKYGEIALSIFAMKEFLQIYITHFQDYDFKKSNKFNTYLVARAYKIMVLLKKQHEDIIFDFTDDLEKIGHLFGQMPSLMKVAIYNGFDVNWLIQNTIPDNIADIEKDLRQRGYLKS